jgi:hypothetical protein
MRARAAAALVEELRAHGVQGFDDAEQALLGDSSSVALTQHHGEASVWIRVEAGEQPRVSMDLSRITPEQAVAVAAALRSHA